MNYYPDDLLQVLEFDRIREKVESYCRCESSRAAALNIHPYQDISRLMQELQRVEEYRSTLENKGYFPDFLFDDFGQEARLLSKQGSMLTAVQCGNLRTANIIVNGLLKFLRDRSISFPGLIELAGELKVELTVAGLVDEYLDNQSMVKSNASNALQKIRSDLYAKSKEADKRFRSFINDMRKKGWLRDNEENFYNNRRVLAVPSEFKRELKGIMHGKSESGKTTFIEPEALIELNNEVAELEQDERTEVIRLMRELSERLRPFSRTIDQYHRFLTGMDLIRAKALFAVSIKARMPKIEKQPVIHLVNACHPLLLLQQQSSGKPVVPLNLTLDKDQRILIISGPNAGGKSITLKTVGLLQLMLQSGLPVPAGEGTRMGFFQHLLTDIGDSQSIEFALSTYSSRLIRMNHFLRMANRKSLVLIDEFGTGTDPELGGAIAEVILEELNHRNAFGVLTTHYTNIKLLADHLTGVTNASMLFDPETLLPKYQLITGQPGSSYTFEVAEKIGLPVNVVNRAKNKVKKDKIKLNTMLSTLHRQKVQLENELQQLKLKQDKAQHAASKFDQLSEKLNSKLERDKSKQEDQRKLAEMGRRFKSLSDEWDQSKDRKAVIKKFVGAMTAEKKKRAADHVPAKVEQRRQQLILKLREEIRIGTEVRLLKSHQTGTVEAIRKDQIHVLFGNIRATVGIENLEVVKKEQATD